MPFEIRTVRTFSAAHQLRLYDRSLEPLHGHNWRVAVTVCAPELDAIDVVMDFHELERLVDAIIVPMHNQHLNDLPAFASLNPSAEGVALFIGRSLALPASIRLVQVEVWETPENSANISTLTADRTMENDAVACSGALTLPDHRNTICGSVDDCNARNSGLSAKFGFAGTRIHHEMRNLRQASDRIYHRNQKR